jgi:hypothetical protein
MTTRTGSELSTQWCCVAFKSRFEAGGERDFAVVVDRFLEGHAFILQHRALEPDDPGPQNHPRPISTVSEVHIHFCPWCGRSLQEFYRARLAEMIRPGLTIPQS